MNNGYSTSDYKAMARQQLTGKYGMAVAIYFLFSVINMVLGLFSFSTASVSSQSAGIMSIILSILTFIFSAGIHFFFYNIASSQDYNLSDLFVIFTQRGGFLKCISLASGQILIELATSIVFIPFAICLAYIRITGADNILLLPLCAILLIIGIIFFVVIWLSMQMFPYIIILNNSHITGIAAISMSYKLMKGQRLRFLYMILSFTGYFILSLLSCGIGLLWVMPYYYTTKANFYNDLCSKN